MVWVEFRDTPPAEFFRVFIDPLLQRLFRWTVVIRPSLDIWPVVAVLPELPVLADSFERIVTATSVLTANTIGMER